MATYIYLKLNGEKDIVRFPGTKTTFDSIVDVMKKNNDIIEHSEPVDGVHEGVVNAVQFDDGSLVGVGRIIMMSTKNLTNQKKTKSKALLKFNDGQEVVAPFSLTEWAEQLSEDSSLFSEKFLLTSDTLVRKAQVAKTK